MIPTRSKVLCSQYALVFTNEYPRYGTDVRSQWLRALDGLNTRDDAYRLSIAGGITVGSCHANAALRILSHSYILDGFGPPRVSKRYRWPGHRHQAQAYQ